MANLHTDILFEGTSWHPPNIGSLSVRPFSDGSYFILPEANRTVIHSPPSEPLIRTSLRVELLSST